MSSSDPRLSQIDSSEFAAGEVPAADGAGGWTGLSPGAPTIEDEGVALTVRPTIDFQGDGVEATDDAANAKTVITIPGVPSSPPGELLMQDGVTSPPVPIETEAGDDWLYQD